MSPVIELRRVSDDDEEFLRAVFAGTRDDIAAAPLSDAERAHLLEMQYVAQRTDYHLRFPRAEHSIVVVDGEPQGRIWIDRQPGEIRLLDIALLPEHRDSGTGRVLLERLIAEATVAGRPLRHSVAVDNEDALRFYSRLGFEVVEDVGMYLLMEWQPHRAGDAATDGS